MWVGLECFIILAQPYPFLEGIYFETENSYVKVKYLYPVNDLLAILSLARTYIIFRGLILLTPYMNNRCTRPITQRIDCAKCMAARLTFHFLSSVYSKTIH